MSCAVPAAFCLDYCLLLRPMCFGAIVSVSIRTPEGDNDEEGYPGVETTYS